MEVSRNISVREIFEARNLARVIEHVCTKSGENDLIQELILLLHQMLITAFKKTPDFQSGDELNADMSSSFRGNPALQSGKDVIGNINETISGRFRNGDEYVRVGSHIGSPPEKITKRMEKLIALGVMESLHKRIVYLKGNEIENLTTYCKRFGKNVSSMLNSAKRQTIFAFREKGIWKISTNLIDSPAPSR